MPLFTKEPGTRPLNHCDNSLTPRHLRCKHEGYCLTAYGRSLLEAFRDANPEVQFTESNNPCFGIVAQGSIRRHFPCAGQGFGVGSLLIDHEGAARVTNDAAVYIPQPYYKDGYEGFDGQKAADQLVERIGQAECLRKRLSGLTLEVRYAGSGRSWYYPGTSALWVIGKPDVVETFNFDYHVPPPPQVLSSREGKEIKPTPETFDAPLPCPSWTIVLPSWECGYVNRRGTRCEEISVLNTNRCKKHRYAD